MLYLAGSKVSFPSFMPSGSSAPTAPEPLCSIVLPSQGVPTPPSAAAYEGLGQPSCSHTLGDTSPMPSPSGPVPLSCPGKVQGPHSMSAVASEEAAPALPLLQMLKRGEGRQNLRTHPTSCQMSGSGQLSCILPLGEDAPTDPQPGLALLCCSGEVQGHVLSSAPAGWGRASFSDCCMWYRGKWREHQPRPMPPHSR